MIDISDSSKNCASFSKDENYFHRVVKETFLSCWREEKEWTVGNLTKLCSRGMMRKKKQEIIYERIWILGELWRVIAYEYSSFIFLFLFLSKQSMKMLQCLSWKCCELLCFSWPKHRPTWKHFNCFQQNIDIIFNYFQCYFFNVIINTSVWEANTKFVHLLRNKFSSNTHYIFKNKLRKHITNISKHHLPELQINSTIYADVAF